MTLTFDLAAAVPADATADVEAVVVGVTADGLADSGLPLAFLAAQGFEAKPAQTAVIAGGDEPDTVVVGLGSSADIDVSVIRRAAAASARVLSRRGVVATRLVETAAEASLDRAVVVQAIVEAMSLACYRYATFKSDPKPVKLERVVLVGVDEQSRPAVDRGVRIADGVALARDLVNEPGGSLTPRRLAEIAVEI